MSIGDWVCYGENQGGEVRCFSADGKKVFVKDAISRKMVELDVERVQVWPREATA